MDSKRFKILLVVKPEWMFVFSHSHGQFYFSQLQPKVMQSVFTSRCIQAILILIDPTPTKYRTMRIKTVKHHFALRLHHCILSKYKELWGIILIYTNKHTNIVRTAHIVPHPNLNITYFIFLIGYWNKRFSWNINLGTGETAQLEWKWMNNVHHISITYSIMHISINLCVTLMRFHRQMTNRYMSCLHHNVLLYFHIFICHNSSAPACHC